MGVPEIMKMIGVGGHTLGAVKKFCEGSEACGRADNKEREMFRLRMCDVTRTVLLEHGWGNEK